MADPPRFGIFDAGLASSENPRYTVRPQRERPGEDQGGHPGADGR